MLVGQSVISVPYVRVQQISERFYFAISLALYGRQPLDELF